MYTFGDGASGAGFREFVSSLVAWYAFVLLLFALDRLIKGPVYLATRLHLSQIIELDVFILSQETVDSVK